MIIELYIKEKKTLVSSCLQTYLTKATLPHVSGVSKWGNDAVNRILYSTVKGKMLRCGLLFLSAYLFSRKQESEAVIQTASALELIQTGLLIHDDIMDQDEARRGLDSMHIQYKKILENDGSKNTGKTGESFALCVGDISFFLAFSLLSKVSPHELSVRLIDLFSEELTKTCVAQMQDVYAGSTQKQLSLEDILSVYAYKTGRYSCGLPLVAGAMIGEARDQTIKQLWKLGTALGIIFQIKDDELNMFGNPEKTGKPAGSDIREGKQTLYHLFLMEKSSPSNKQKLLSLFGNPKITESDCVFIKDQIKTLQIEKDVSAIIGQQRKVINEVLSHLPLHKEGRVLLEEFISYITEREK